MIEQIRKLKNLTGVTMSDLARHSFLTRQYVQILSTDDSKKARMKLANMVDLFAEDWIETERRRLDRHIAKLQQVAAEFREIAENTPDDEEQSA